MEKVLEFGRKYKYLILSGVVILMMIIAGLMVYLFGDKKEEVVEDVIKEEVAVVEPKVEILEEEKEESITIDIKGEVKIPGVYELPLNSRVIDAINISGGLTNKADTSDINLSKILKDENVIVISNKYSNQTTKYTKKETSVVNNASTSKDNVVSSNNSSDTNTNKTNDKVSINTATKEQLMNLNGIGESKANDIIAYRNQNGLFKSIEDIKKVSGIGDKLFDKIKDHITI